MSNRTYCYSRLSADDIGHLVEENYNLATPVNSKFYTQGLHDNYLIRSSDTKFILRVYRNSWRTHENIRFELDLLFFLSEKTSLIASPLLTNKGKPLFFINSPEGKRAAVLFSYADGIAPGNKMSLNESKALGSAVAKIHLASKAFNTNYTRPTLEPAYLIDQSIISIKPFINKNSLAYIEDLQIKLNEALTTLQKDTSNYGICIGDVNSGNFHINAEGKITLFDFDQCGYGYRAFEIAKFNSSIHLDNKNDITQAFINGYQQINRLTRKELYSIPYYEIACVLWVMAIHADNVDHIGYKFLEKSFWDRRLERLKNLEDNLESRSEP